MQRPDVGAAIAYAREARPRFLAGLARFVRWPSISAEPRHRADVARCAAWLAGHLRGIETSIHLLAALGQREENEHERPRAV